MDSSRNRDTSSSSPVNDSTCKLLADLDLIETHSYEMLNLDEVDDDLTMVIPDTPDRMTSAYLDENDGNNIANPSSLVARKRRTSNARGCFAPRTNGSLTFDNASIFRRARIARTLGHHSHPQNLRTSTKPGRDSALPRDQQGSSVDGCHKADNGEYSTQCMRREINNRKGSFKDGCSHSTNEVEDLTSFSQFQVPLRSTRSGTCSSKLPKINEVCSLSINEVDNTVTATPVNRDSRLRYVKSPSHSFKGRKLVRNGVISPCHTSKEKSIDLEGDMSDTCEEMIPNLKHFSNTRSSFVSSSEMLKGSNFKNENNCGIKEAVNQVSQDASTSFQIHCISPDSEKYRKAKAKGKEVLDESLLVNGQEAEPRTFSDRFGPVGAKGNASTSTTHKDKITENAVSENSLNNRRRAFDSGLSLCDVHENSIKKIEHVDLIHTSPENNCFEPPHSLCNAFNEKYHKYEQNTLKGKRKTRSRRSHDNGCSTSGINGDFSLSLFGKSSNASINQNSSWHSTNATIIDVEELPSSEPRNTQNHLVFNESNARDLQVESDELLAREIQEQLFNESPGLGGFEESDASIAWTLQEEEDVQRTRVRSQRSQHRGESIGHLYRHYSRQTLPSTSQRPQNNPRSANYRLSQLRRNLNRRQMDLESNLNILEALEDAYNTTDPTISSNNLLDIHRDFNENDYEMLLALDNDNHQHVGASSYQIANLPLSVMQSESSEEACAVCLENPTVGDTMRHLPCLHKFHKDCIDAWLKVKTSCPICKSDIA